jgi:DNA helicase-2/ATP-dependent DNA helicase PcrA
MVRTATVPQILARLYELTSVREHFLGRGDRQAAENLEKLREVARHLFRNEQALTLRAFVGALKRNLQSGAEESEALLAPGEEAERPNYVRLLTVHGAKGLEFPLVIIPEVQAALINPDLDPVFLLGDHGLDLNLSGVGLTTESPRFRTTLQASRTARLGEEMRVFYVAVTRAQHAVTFVGTKGGSTNAPGDDYYSWKDELRRAWAEVQALGAEVIT